MAHNNQYTKDSNNSQGKSMRGGTPEQHAEAGRQSHKNSGSKDSGSSRSESSSNKR